MARCALTARETAGVGVGAEVSVTWNPFPARISATRCANWSERKRRSKPTTALVWVPVIGFAFQQSAVACATRSTFVKVKSSAMTARQPSVPNLICPMISAPASGLCIHNLLHLAQRCLEVPVLEEPRTAHKCIGARARAVARGLKVDPAVRLDAV